MLTAHPDAPVRSAALRPPTTRAGESTARPDARARSMAVRPSHVPPTGAATLSVGARPHAPPPEGVVERFTAAVTRWPDEAAIVGEDGALSRREVDALSRGIAAAVRARVHGATDDPV